MGDQSCFAAAFVSCYDQWFVLYLNLVLLLLRLLGFALIVTSSRRDLFLFGLLLLLINVLVAISL